MGIGAPCCVPYFCSSKPFFLIHCVSGSVQIEHILLYEMLIHTDKDSAGSSASAQIKSVVDVVEGGLYF